jgi:hypothetical protein
MMCCLIVHCRRDDNFPRLGIFPVRDATFIQNENQFSPTPLDVFIQILDSSVEQHSDYTQALLLFRDIFGLSDFVGKAKNKQIHPAGSD